MNEREIYCRAKASEARTAARVATTTDAKFALNSEALDWERKAYEAAADGSSSGPPPTDR